MVSSRSRCRFFGQVRLVLLLSQKNPSLSSNQTGFSCTAPPSRLVAITTRIGSAASIRTAGLSADAFLAPAIDRAGHTQRLDLHLDATRPRVLIVTPHVAMREMVDMVTARILRPIDHPTLDLRPAPHVLGIDQQQGDPWIALQVLEPATISPTIDPERAILLLEPDGNHLDRTVLAVAADDHRKDLLGARLHLGAELNCHQTTSHLHMRKATPQLRRGHHKRPS